MSAISASGKMTWKAKEFIALISFKKDMKPLKETSLRFGEILHYVGNKCLGLSNFHMAAL
jgi:hypothetical protein